jgi:hypothetical protein
MVGVGVRVRDALGSETGTTSPFEGVNVVDSVCRPAPDGGTTDTVIDALGNSSSTAVPELSVVSEAHSCPEAVPPMSGNDVPVQGRVTVAPVTGPLGPFTVRVT